MDHKDALIEALCRQRNEAINNVATLYAETAVALAKKDAEIAELKTKLENEAVGQ